MQISRLFEMLYLLMCRERIPAKELARHFEVSIRTIYRDIDVLSGAGIPVYAAKGRGGGIQLLPGFVLQKSYFSQAEQGDILAALQSLSAANVPEVNSVLYKLGALFRRSSPQWVAIDFSDWSMGSHRKFEQLKKAILEHRVIEFTYYNSVNEKTRRSAEPLQLWFKHRAWYLRAHCLNRNAPRLFKLTRMRDIVLTDTPCTKSGAGYEQDFPPTQQNMPPACKLLIRLSASAAYRVYDEFDETQITRNEDGSFTVRAHFVMDDWLYGYLLSFGSGAEVLEPAHVRASLGKLIARMHEKYSEDF